MEKRAKKSLPPPDADKPRSPRGGDLEALSIRLNDGDDAEQVNPAFSEPATVEQQRPSMKHSSPWKLSRKGRSRKPSFVPSHDNTDHKFEAVSIRLSDEPPPIEAADEADWDGIQTFLTAVADAAESASEPVTTVSGKVSPTSATESQW